MLEVKNITKKFDAVVALNNANFHVNGGEIRALLGSNGSGKSTLVKALSGLVTPNAGEILIDGQKVSIGDAADSRKLGIAVAYQDLSLIQSMSVMDNIILGNEPVKALQMLEKSKARQLTLEILKRLKIECQPETLVQNLTPSMQSMVEVGKAIALNPQYLFLDEVTASLHHDEVDTLFEVLEELKKEGVAITIVTHRMEEIYRICDTCTILKSGETVAEGIMKEMDLDEVIFHMTGKRPEAVSKTTENQTHKDTEIVLEAQNIKLWPKVKDISLNAHKGEIVGIGGLEGQGQSEVMRCILGVTSPEKGKLSYKVKEVKYKSPAQAIKDGMGFVSGDRNKEAIFSIRSVAENIFAGSVTKKKMFSPLSPKTVNGFAQSAVDEFGIKIGGLKNPASSLSGGNQQKLVVGRWIALAPDLLLLDDPTKGVDINSRREIHKILKECTEKGMTVIISSSDNKELLEISDRIYIFYEGQVSGVLEGADRTEEKLVSAMMGIGGTEETEKGETSNE